MLYGILLSLLILISIFLIVFVLMQSDKGGGLSGTFGGGSGNMPFSGRETASFLSKATTGLAIFFMAICIILNLLSRNRAETSSNSTLQQRAKDMQKRESKSASSVLDRSIMPIDQNEDSQQNQTKQNSTKDNKISIPGVTKDKQ